MKPKSHDVILHTIKVFILPSRGHGKNAASLMFTIILEKGSKVLSLKTRRQLMIFLMISKICSGLFQMRKHLTLFMTS